MPTVMTHPAPILALAAGFGLKIIPLRLLLAGVIFSILPDCDVISFRFGIKYTDFLGHRGFSHSLAFAGSAGLIGFAIAPWLRARRITAMLILFAAVASHILLDAMTNGGRGVAAFWPLTDERFFLPWRPVLVSPFSVKAFMTSHGVRIMQSETLYIWFPCTMIALLICIARRKN